MHKAIAKDCDSAIAAVLRCAIISLNCAPRPRVVSNVSAEIVPCPLAPHERLLRIALRATRAKHIQAGTLTMVHAEDPND